MVDQRKSTVFGLLLIGLCCMAFGWIVEMLYFVNLRAGQLDEDIASVLDDVANMRQLTAILYIVGAIFILAGGVQGLRLPVAELDTEE